MVDPNQRELAELAECFDLPPLAVEDATAPHHRPKYAHYNQTDFMVLQLVQVVGTPITSDAVRTPGLIDIRVSEVHACNGASFVIAISYSQAIDLTTVRSTFERDPWFLQSPRLSTVYRIMDEVVDRYEPPLSALEDYADSLEERIFGSGPVPSQDVYYLSRELIELDVAQSPHCGVWWAHYPLPLTVTLRRRTSFVA